MNNIVNVCTKKSNIEIMLLNCKSLFKRLSEVRKLLLVKSPDVVCFNETWLEDRVPKFLGYDSVWKHRNRQGGGVGILIKNSVTFLNVNLTPYIGGSLEVIAIKVPIKGGRYLYILNIYNPKDTFSFDEFVHYKSQIGNIFIIMGDLNTHSQVLDTTVSRRNGAGRTLEEVLMFEQICLVNKQNLYTYVCPTNGKKSCLDVCLVAPSIASDTSLIRGPDVGSDHYPMVAKIVLEAERSDLSHPERYIIKSADWKTYTHELKKINNLENMNSVEEINEALTSVILSVANVAIPIKKSRPAAEKKKRYTPWWNVSCSKAVAERRRARRKLEKFPNEINLANYRSKTQEATNVIEKAKRNSFEAYVSSITKDTPISEVWRKIKSINSAYAPQNYNIVQNGKQIINTQEKCDLFAYTFAEINNTNISNENKSKKIQEGLKLDSHEAYNESLTENEIMLAIRKLKSTSPGGDKVHNYMLKNLTRETILQMLSMFNKSFSAPEIPNVWKLGTVIPIHKPGKDKTSVLSYRPISLLSCIGKLMERIIQRRLEWYVESKGLLMSSQSGFRKQKSTMDVLLQIEHNVRLALQNGEHLLVVYVDLTSAFDKVSPQGLLYKLSEAGLRGKMLAWLEEYFKHRRMKVRIGDTVSGEKVTRAGVPQGAILSPMLFNIMLMDIPQNEEIKFYSYADDMTLSIAGKDRALLRRKMQHYLNEVTKWLQDWGMVINKTKSVMQIFTRQRKLDMVLRIGNTAISTVKEHKLLGLILDAPSLTWAPHIDYLRRNCLRRVDTMKTISSAKWGASRRVLKNYYLAYIRSKLDYGSILYNRASKTI